ncbi:MAG: DUF4258 domain-containing protein [Candidatus Aenigmatarchaeota archaeon]
MEMRITDHARERMEKYDIPEKLVKKAINKPDNMIKGHTNRKIAQLKLNGYMLRVVFEKNKDINVVVTTYKARSERYEI